MDPRDESFLKPAQRQQNMQLNVDVPHLQDFLNIRVDFLNSKRKILRVILLLIALNIW